MTHLNILNITREDDGGFKLAANLSTDSGTTNHTCDIYLIDDIWEDERRMSISCETSDSPFFFINKRLGIERCFAISEGSDDLKSQLGRIVVQILPQLNNKIGSDYCLKKIDNIAGRSPYNFDVFFTKANLEQQLCYFHLWEPKAETNLTDVEIHCDDQIYEFQVENVSDDLRVRDPNVVFANGLYSKVSEMPVPLPRRDYLERDINELLKYLETKRGVTLRLIQIENVKNGENRYVVDVDADVNTDEGVRRCKLELTDNNELDILKLNVSCGDDNYEITKQHGLERCLSFSDGESETLLSKFLKIAEDSLNQLNDESGSDYCVGRFERIAEDDPHNFDVLLSTSNFDNKKCKFHLIETSSEFDRLMASQPETNRNEIQIDCDGKMYRIFSDLSLKDSSYQIEKNSTLQKTLRANVDSLFQHYIDQAGSSFKLIDILSARRKFGCLDTFMEADVSVANDIQRCSLELYDQFPKDVRKLVVTCGTKSSEIVKELEEKRCLSNSDQQENDDQQLIQIAMDSLPEISKQNWTSLCLGGVEADPFTPFSSFGTELPAKLFFANLTTRNSERHLCNFNYWNPRAESNYTETEVLCGNTNFKVSNINDNDLSNVDSAEFGDVQMSLEIVFKKLELESGLTLNRTASVKRFSTTNTEYKIQSILDRYGVPKNCTIIYSKKLSNDGKTVDVQLFEIKCFVPGGVPDLVTYTIDKRKHKLDASDNQLENVIKQSLTELNAAQPDVKINFVRIVPDSAYWQLDNVKKQYYFNIEVASANGEKSVCNLEIGPVDPTYKQSVDTIINCDGEIYDWFFNAESL